MRRKFLTWLSAVIFSAFLMTAVLVYTQYSAHVEERAEQLMSTRLNDMLDFLRHTEKAVNFLSSANDTSTQDRASAVAEILKLDPGIIHHQEKLQGLCNRIGAEQLAITDENGIVEAAVPQSYVGLNLQDGDDIRPITTQQDDGSQMVAVVSEQDIGSMQFAAVDRLERPGKIRLGFITRLEQESRAEASLRSDGVKLRIGDQGTIIVYRRGVRLTQATPEFSDTELLTLPLGKVSELSSEEGNSFAYAVDGNGFRIIGLVPVKEVHRAVLRTVQLTLASNLVLFIMMFGVVSWLLQRIVLNGISSVNETLMQITEGDLEKKVEVRTSEEFEKLSNGINFMVDSLRSVGEERQFQVKRDLKLARAIQSASLPSKFPAFPNVPEFNLCATCLQANDVGGDFYDFSMPDDKHLRFLVADVDASGIPAALYMMRAMALIRTLARSGGSLQDLIHEVNRELSEDNQSGIHMTLFYGSLDIVTGDLIYVNAGRVHGLLQRYGLPYDTLSDATPNPGIGEDINAGFRATSMKLSPGDRLFLYTAGVLSNNSSTNIPYSESQLKEALQEDAPEVADVLRIVRTSLRHYNEGENLMKDVTMLCLEYCGAPSNQEELEFTAADSQQAVDCVSQQMEELFASPPDIEAVQNAVRSVLSVLPPDRNVRMFSNCTEKRMDVQLSFAAPPFNPLEQLSSLPVDGTSYELSVNNENVVCLCKNLT